jgi:hypothetical protein
MGEMRATYRQLPGAFDTKGAESAYGAMIGQNLGQAQSTTATMAKAAQSRASRTGGAVAGSFVAGSAMLPYYQQGSEMLGQLEDYKLRAAQSRMGLQADMAAQMAGIRQRQQGMLGDFFNMGENRAQAGSQFDRSLGQSEKQFAAQHALRLRQQQEDEDRYDDSLSLQQSRYGRGGRGLPSFGNVAAMMGAHNAALGNPMAAHYWQQMQQAGMASGAGDQDVFGTGY